MLNQIDDQSGDHAGKEISLKLQTVAEKFSAAHSEMAARVRVLLADIEKINQAARPELTTLAMTLATATAELKVEIEDSPEMFVKPKTRLIARIKCGFRKQKGHVVLENEENVISRIRKSLSKEQADTMIRVKESVNKNTAMTLDMHTLKQLGISVIADEDVVVIDAGDKAVDKILAEIMDSAKKKTD